MMPGVVGLSAGAKVGWSLPDDNGYFPGSARNFVLQPALQK
jgi:hypothetical protein